MMGNQFVSSTFLLVLLVTLHGLGNYYAVAAGDVLRLPGEDHEHVKHGHGHSHMSMVADVDPASKVQVFFRLKDLKVGNVIPTYFPPDVSLSKSLRFLPRPKADSIPFSTKALPFLLRFFGYPPNSPRAKAMADTLRECESTPIEGEVKHCATSWESLLEFVTTVLGPRIKILTTSTKTTVALQNYTVLHAEEIKAPHGDVVACHNLAYPYVVYHCHNPGFTRLFKVSMAGHYAHDKVDALSVCHMDTSLWGPEHASFALLGVKPGESEVCHFFPADHLVIIAAEATTAA